LNWALKGALFVALAFALAACVREIPREENTPVVVASATTQPATPTATAVSVPEPTATADPKPADTPVPVSVPPTPIAPITPDPTATPEAIVTLTLDMRGPEDGSIVQTDGVIVHGIASKGSQVTVNGISTSLNEDDRFSMLVDLEPGENQINITASSGSEQTSKTIKITSLVPPPQPFFLLVTQPEDQSITSASQIPLGGRTIPGAVVSVNGVSVPVDPVGIYSTMLSLNEGPNIIDVLATDSAGEVLSTIIAVIYRP
jgi:hypothetical protein